jgi:hypothetical protein
MAYTDRQTKIMEWLTRVSPHSGRLFEASLRLTADTALPCRGRFVAHAYREICISLLKQDSSNAREEIAPRLDRLKREYAKLAIAPEPAPPMGGDALAADSGALSVSRAFIQSVDAVVKLHSAAPKGRERAHAMFVAQGAGPRVGNSGASQTADRWFEMYNYFVRCAHNKDDDDNVLMAENFAREALFFEDTLLSFAEPAIANLDALDDILEEANA